MTPFRMAVGVGNTTVKLGLTSAVVSGDWPTWHARHETATSAMDAATLAQLLPAESVEWLVASVRRPTEQSLREWIRVNRPADRYRLLTFRDLPLRILVDAPERVGLDRLAAGVAVNALRDPERPAVFVDAGTAITVNLISADGAFQGGVILPGFSLTAKALSSGTDLLPLVTTDGQAEPPAILGKSTETAIRSGIFWGSVGAVREIVHRLQDVCSGRPQVFVTGGDAQRLAGFVTPDARFVSDLVLGGIILSATRQTS